MDAGFSTEQQIDYFWETLRRLGVTTQSSEPADVLVELVQHIAYLERKVEDLSCKLADQDEILAAYGIDQPMTEEEQAEARRVLAPLLTY